MQSGTTTTPQQLFDFIEKGQIGLIQASLLKDNQSKMTFEALFILINLETDLPCVLDLIKNSIDQWIVAFVKISSISDEVELEAKSNKLIALYDVNLSHKPFASYALTQLENKLTEEKTRTAAHKLLHLYKAKKSDLEPMAELRYTFYKYQFSKDLSSIQLLAAKGYPEALHSLAQLAKTPKGFFKKAPETRKTLVLYFTSLIQLYTSLVERTLPTELIPTLKKEAHDYIDMLHKDSNHKHKKLINCIHEETTRLRDDSKKVDHRTESTDPFARAKSVFEEDPELAAIFLESMDKATDKKYSAMLKAPQSMPAQNTTAISDEGIAGAPGGAVLSQVEGIPASAPSISMDAKRTTIQIARDAEVALANDEVKSSLDHYEKLIARVYADHHPFNDHGIRMIIASLGKLKNADAERVSQLEKQFSAQIKQGSLYPNLYAKSDADESKETVFQLASLAETYYKGRESKLAFENYEKLAVKISHNNPFNANYLREIVNHLTAMKLSQELLDTFRTLMRVEEISDEEMTTLETTSTSTTATTEQPSAPTKAVEAPASIPILVPVVTLPAPIATPTVTQVVAPVPIPTPTPVVALPVVIAPASTPKPETLTMTATAAPSGVQPQASAAPQQTGTVFTTSTMALAGVRADVKKPEQQKKSESKSPLGHASLFANAAQKSNVQTTGPKTIYKKLKTRLSMYALALGDDDPDLLAKIGAVVGPEIEALGAQIKDAALLHNKQNRNTQ